MEASLHIFFQIGSYLTETSRGFTLKIKKKKLPVSVNNKHFQKMSVQLLPS